jgi:hypothetical protein
LGAYIGSGILRSRIDSTEDVFPEGLNAAFDWKVKRIFDLEKRSGLTMLFF